VLTPWSAPGCLVVSNAAAVLLALTGLARRKEVLVPLAVDRDRGGFRIPEIMQQSGAKLREVSTTSTPPAGLPGRRANTLP
jgi:L-seryl-tRNA(Ser) seleniumtransferase